MEKATNETFAEIDKMKESVDQEDIQQSMNFIQNCLHLQCTTMECLGKAMDHVLYTSMTLALNLLLNRRDNFPKLCNRDVMDKDIARLKNASLIKKEFCSQNKQGDQNKRQSGSYNSNRGSARGGRGRRK